MRTRCLLTSTIQCKTRKNFPHRKRTFHLMKWYVQLHNIQPKQVQAKFSFDLLQSGNLASICRNTVVQESHTYFKKIIAK